MERDAVGRDGERYEWARLLGGQIREGLLTSPFEFDVENEEQAFAYAEERMFG